MKNHVIQRGPSLRGVIALLQAAGLPTSDLTEGHLSSFLFSGSSADPNGIVGLEFLGSEALLRSLVVTPALRATGLGVALVNHAEAYARGVGVDSMFLLTTTAESFFKRLGYITTDRSTAPVSIGATREFADICPASSAFMVKRFGGILWNGDNK
jgi:amino-acid N-acetyltransferase